MSLLCFTGCKECVPVPSLQDKDARPHIRLDLQPEEQGEASQMGAGRGGSAAAGVSTLLLTRQALKLNTMDTLIDSTRTYTCRDSTTLPTGQLSTRHFYGQNYSAVDICLN